MADAKDMACVHCWKRKQYPDGFPNRSYACCWECAWNDHIRDEHPEVGRRIRRAAKKRARRITARDVEQAMFDSERAQVLGLDTSKGAIAEEDNTTKEIA